jgi:DNA polymerase III subunit delta'
MSLKLHPRYIKKLIGHHNEKKIFEDCYLSNSLHHCWLLEGPAGIGKASFAYCAARSILSISNQQNNEVSLFPGLEKQNNSNILNFNYETNNTIHNRISENTHVDLKIIERSDADKNSHSNEIIPVNKVREIENFFSKTSGEGGWRIAIIDSLDNLNKHGSNALLKILEEPPEKCLIFLISSNKSNVIDTIKSRSRILKFLSLNIDDTNLVIENLMLIKDIAELKKINLLANGSPGRGIMLFNNNGLEIYNKLINLFLKIPDFDTNLIDSLVKDVSSVKNIFGIKIINILITIFLIRTYKRALKLININFSDNEQDSQDNIIKNFDIKDIPFLWENIFTQINLTADFNLDKKQAIISLINNIKELKIT